jgi:hypothetical protein
MTDATASDLPFTRPRAAPLRLPHPQPFGVPVLIGDAVSPLAGETVLSLLWKRLHREDAD